MRIDGLDDLLGLDVDDIDVLRHHVERLSVRRGAELGRKEHLSDLGRKREAVDHPVGLEIVAHDVDVLGKEAIDLHPHRIDGDEEHFARGVGRGTVHPDPSLGRRELHLVHHRPRGDVHHLHGLHPIGDEEEAAGVGGAIGSEDIGDRSVAKLHLADRLLGRLVEEPEPVGPDPHQERAGIGRGGERRDEARERGEGQNADGSLDRHLVTSLTPRDDSTSSGVVASAGNEPL